MNLPKRRQNNLKNVTPEPYKELFIYYLQGRLKAKQHLFNENFIGNWELELATAITPPETVLDLGTGSGLLALAAARLGCRKICAIDVNMLAKVLKTWTQDGIWHTLYGKRC